MERKKVFEKMVEICRDIFENDKLVVTELTNAAEVENWDSLHL